MSVVAFGPVEDLSIDATEELFVTNTFVPIMGSQGRRSSDPIFR